MLKIYVHSMNLLDRKYSAFTARNDDGFVSAETIAIAVAGVLIVGAIWVVFRDQLTGVIEGLGDSITGIDDSGSTP